VKASFLILEVRSFSMVRRPHGRSNTTLNISQYLQHLSTGTEVTMLLDDPGLCHAEGAVSRSVTGTLAALSALSHIFKLKEGTFRLDIRKVLPVRVAKHWHRFTQRGGGHPILGNIQGQAGQGSEHLMELWVSLLTAGDLDQVAFKGSFPAQAIL